MHRALTAAHGATTELPHATSEHTHNSSDSGSVDAKFSVLPVASIRLL